MEKFRSNIKTKLKIIWSRFYYNLQIGQLGFDYPDCDEIIFADELNSVLSYYETYCVADCCGLDAFTVTDPRIDDLKAGMSVESMKRCLDEINEVENVLDKERKCHFNNRRLNVNTFGEGRNRWLRLMRKIREDLDQIISES